MDYYKTLDLNAATATHEQVAASFRKLSILAHPLRQSDNFASNTHTFNQLCEAYQVLSDPKLKQIYDKSGHPGLKNIGTKKDGRTQGAYVYNGKSFEIFSAFFGNSSPFTDNFDQQKVLSTSNDPADPNAPKDIVVKLDCTVNEFYNGSLKTFKFFRQKLMADGRSIQ